LNRTWTTRLSDYRTPPLSLNDRMHWRKRAKITAEIRGLVCAWASTAVPACSATEVELHYVPRDARRRDADNLVPILKACCDGLVDAGVVPDDTPELMRKVMPIIDAPNRVDPHLWLLVRES
jgi:crossover junction endodeoxyribonuclease RusA